MAFLRPRGGSGRLKRQSVRVLVILHHRAAEYLIDPGYQPAGSPEIGGQAKGLKGKHYAGAAAQAVTGLQKQAQFGLAPAIDGLPGVDHHRQGAASPGLPAGKQPAQEIFLIFAGVLKLIHQKMQAPVQTQKELAQAFRGQKFQRGHLQINKVQDAFLPAEFPVHGHGFPQQ